MKRIGERFWTSLLVVLLPLLLIFSYASTAAAQAPGTFVPTSNMTSPRDGHTATLLPNGNVLIAGGSSERPASAELFDPVTGMFTATGDTTTGRRFHSATLLTDGRVLIAGGSYPVDLGPTAPTTAAELYDPSTGTFTATGNMIATHSGHRATMLDNGEVLITGGGRMCPNLNDGCEIVDRPELYDPVTGMFTVTGDYADRNGDPWYATAGLVTAPATSLPTGKVLIAAEPTAELYDPSTGTFGLTGQMTRGAYVGQVPGWELGGTSTLLRSGRVLLAGGEYFETGYYDEAELYDPLTSQFTAISRMTKGRDGHTATLLSDGTVLIAGGYGNDTPTFASSEVYDPTTGTFTAAAQMTSSRTRHTATLLMDGRVLMAGGWVNSASAELYVPSALLSAQLVSNLHFDRTSVSPGSSYIVEVSGSNLTPQTFFDVRFTAPGSKDSAVVLNWQRGLAVNHDVTVGITSGTWTINGIRAHEIETDHAGDFFPVTATITVSP